MTCTRVHIALWRIVVACTIVATTSAETKALRGPETFDGSFRVFGARTATDFERGVDLEFEEIFKRSSVGSSSTVSVLVPDSGVYAAGSKFLETLYVASRDFTDSMEGTSEYGMTPDTKGRHGTWCAAQAMFGSLGKGETPRIKFVSAQLGRAHGSLLATKKLLEECAPIFNKDSWEDLNQEEHIKCKLFNVVKAIEWGIQQEGVKVVSCSVVVLFQAEEVQKLMEEHPNVLFIWTSGNSNSEYTVDDRGRAYDLGNNILVGGTDRSFQRDDMFGYGPGVDIGVPGTQTALYTGPKFAKVLQKEGVDAHVVDGDLGVSFGLPVIANTAAKMFAICPGLSPSQVRSILMKTARQEESLKGINAASGVADPVAAYRLALDECPGPA